MGASHSCDDNIYLITYNCQIKFFSSYKSNRLLNYINNFKNTNFILCLQGLYDYKTIKYLEDNIYYKNIQKINNVYENGLYIFCTFNIHNIEQHKYTLNKKYKNFIDDKKGFITFDIHINKNLVTIYNTELQNDISNNLLFNEIRIQQVSEILYYITNKSKNDTKKKRVNIIMGTMYMDSIKSNRLCDVISVLEKNTNSIITNIDDNSQDDYILFITEKKIDCDQIINFMKDEYGIFLVSVNIRSEMNFSKNLPCEIVLKVILK